MKLLLSLFVISLLFGYITPISVINGGYEDLNIVIQDSIEDDNNSDILLERIQGTFTKASELLFKATKNYFYFRKIKVIIPKTWQLKQIYKRAQISSFIEQKIIIDNVEKDGLDTPRVYGVICGKGGSYMFLNSKSFFLKSGRTDWGRHENVIVHEFGHQRYGLFDEYSLSNNSAQFYQDEQEWKPTRCTEKVKGRIGIGANCIPSNECDNTNNSKQLNINCNFCPEQDQNVSASLMGFQWINNLSMFCEESRNTTPEHVRHNNLAKNKQNILCNYQSAWEVMRKHQDFIGAQKLPSSTDTRPIFEFIQESEKYRFLVLDVSGSMKGERLEKLRQVAKIVIKNWILFGSYLGIIVFSDKANVINPLTEINSDSVLEELIKTLPKKAEGATCIGCGIEHAIETLESELEIAENSEIIVISDGENNAGNITLSREKIVSRKVIVHTISVTQNADVLLAAISEESRGKHFTYLENGTNTFISLFDEIIRNSPTSASRQPVLLASERIDRTASNVIHFAFPMESDLGKDTSVTVLIQSNYSGQLNLNLTGPNNFLQTASTNEKTATLWISNIAEAGDYEVTITMGQSGLSLEYVVKSTPTSNNVVRIDAFPSSSKINYKTGDLPIINAEVSVGYSPMLKAVVVSRVETDDGSRGCDIHLYDNGIDPDGIRDDGSYTAYILPYCLRNGRVNVKIVAKGQKGETLIKKFSSGARITYPVDQQEVFGDAFQRVRLMEDIYIENFVDPGLNDTVAPGRITDVDIHHIVTQSTKYGESRNYTISWTAPGDDKNIGQASGYIFRISNDFETLLNNFENAELLYLGNFSFIPLKSGEKEALKIVVDAEQSYTSTVFFAIKAVDEARNVGEVSNILSVVVANSYCAFGEAGNFEVDDINEEEEEEEEQEEQEQEEGKEKTQSTIIYIIIGSAAGVFVFLTIALAVWFYRNRRVRKSRRYEVEMRRV